MNLALGHWEILNSTFQVSKKSGNFILCSHKNFLVGNGNVASRKFSY